MIWYRSCFSVPWSLCFEPTAGPSAILESLVLIQTVRVGRGWEGGQMTEEVSCWVQLCLLEIPHISRDGDGAMGGKGKTACNLTGDVLCELPW